MSIRLRLTLLYSTILALTLIVFGVALYTTQAQDTLNTLKRDITFSSGLLLDAMLRMKSLPFQPIVAQREPPPPKQFNEFSNEQEFRNLREREIVRVLDANGILIASPFGRVEDALPLSEAGLEAIHNQQEWWEDDIVSEEHLLILSRPIMQDGVLISIVQVARSLTERDSTLKSLATTLGIAGLFTILIAFGVGWILSGLSLRPIHQIAQTAQTIGVERDFTRRVSYSGPQDEVGHLADTFNQMLIQLQDAYQKIAHTLKMQRNFVADVSHELRTPLTTLRGNLELLRHDPPAPPEEQSDILLDMVDESDRLIRLVNELLVLARADAGRDMNKAQLDICLVIEEVVRQVHQLNPQREITLHNLSDLKIVGDRDAFKQVVLILLDNALKHSKGTIKVCAQTTVEGVEIQVQDQGEGVSPEILPHIFDRFYRGGETAAILGFGLGLPIAKALVEGMGGSIRMDSELGKGSNVYIRFTPV